MMVPYLKIHSMVGRYYVKSFILSAKSAQFGDFCQLSCSTSLILTPQYTWIGNLSKLLHILVTVHQVQGNLFSVDRKAARGFLNSFLGVHTPFTLFSVLSFVLKKNAACW